MMKKLIPIVALTGFFFSCSSDSADRDNGNINGKDSLAAADTGHIFVLPTPLQVATFLHTHAQTSHIEYLSDKSQPVSNYATDYQRALNLGVCIADVGYAALYNNRQLALDYLSRSEELIKALRLEPAASPYIVRIRTNIENRDSLSYLLLSMYNDVQQNLNQAKREKTAFYIVSGCYLENLAITMQHEKLQTNTAFNQLVAQEKLWLDNITEALTYLEPDDESQDLYNTFYTLQHYSTDVVVSIGKDNKPSCTFTPEVYSTLMKKSIQLRDEVTGKKAA